MLFHISWPFTFIIIIENLCGKVLRDKFEMHPYKFRSYNKKKACVQKKCKEKKITKKNYILIGAKGFLSPS